MSQRWVLGALALFLVVVFTEPASPDQPLKAEAENRLIQALSDPSFKVRLQAAILIGKHKISRAAPVLRRTVDDEHESVRAAAVVSLGKLGDQPSREKVVSLLNDLSRLVARAAEKSLISLDRIRGRPRYLVAMGEPKASEGLAASRRYRLIRVLKNKLNLDSQIVLSAGEERTLSGDKLSSHLMKRKLVGILLWPKILTLDTKVGGGTTKVLCKVSVMIATLIDNRIEFVAGGKADAQVEQSYLSEDDQLDLENTALDASATAAAEQLIDYLMRKSER